MWQIALGLFLILILGTLIVKPLWRGENRSIYILMLFGFSVGVSVLPAIGYVAIILSAYNAFVLYSLSSIFIIFLTLLCYRQHLLKVPQLPSIDRKTIGIVVIPLLVSLIAFYLRARSVIVSFALSDLDPWFWLYLTRYLIEYSTIDYVYAKAYPLGFTIFTSFLVIGDSTLDIVYVFFQYIGSFLSLVTTIAVFRIFYDYFGESIQAGLIGSLGFAVGNYLQYRGRMATPETLALLLFVMFLSSLFVYRPRSYRISGLLMAGLVLTHPTTGALAIGIWVLSDIKIPNRMRIRAASRNILEMSLVAIIVSLPTLISIAMNENIIERYVYYAGDSGAPWPSLPLLYIQTNINTVIIGSLGAIMFGISVIAVLRLVFTRLVHKWAIIGWLVCLLWATSGVLPIIFFRASALRSASFLVFPGMILVVSEYRRIVATIMRAPRLSKSRLKKPEVMTGLLLLLVVGIQVSYGFSYAYVNERYISGNDVRAMMFIENLDEEFDYAFIYNDWRPFAHAILVRVYYEAKDEVRHNGFAAFLEFFNYHGGKVLIVVKDYESFHLQFQSMGLVDLYNRSSTHMFLYEYSG